MDLISIRIPVISVLGESTFWGLYVGSSVIATSLRTENSTIFSFYLLNIISIHNYKDFLKVIPVFCERVIIIILF